jgi:hypothetical protein
MLPFSREQFFDIFAAYNAAIWPAAIAAYPLAFAAIVLAWRGTRQGSSGVAAILALMWAWVGIIYHGLYFSQINPVARGFATAFLLQAGLFAFYALRDGLEFKPPTRIRAIVGAILMSYAMIAYPLMGLFLGEQYPAVPLFGIAPCPLLIFTFGLLLWASCTRWWLWLIPLVWSIIGGSATIVLSVPQDWALPLSAVVVMLIKILDHQIGPAIAHR